MREGPELICQTVVYIRVCKGFAPNQDGFVVRHDHPLEKGRPRAPPRREHEHGLLFIVGRLGGQPPTSIAQSGRQVFSDLSCVCSEAPSISGTKSVADDIAYKVVVRVRHDLEVGQWLVAAQKSIRALGKIGVSLRSVSWLMVSGAAV